MILLGPILKVIKGVRQGDPLSPILFNFVADGLSRMILKAQSNDLFCSLIDHIVDKGQLFYSMLMIPLYV